MKIEREGNIFNPVTIRLETEEDFEDMLHIFRRSTDVSLDQYINNQNITGKKKERLLKFDSDMDDKLREVS